MTKTERRSKILKVNVKGGEISDKEREEYIKTALKRNTHRTVEEINITVVDNDYVDIETVCAPEKFQRIRRRITGYLVGTLDRFNDAKSAEVRDRVGDSLAHVGFEDVFVD